MAKLLMPSELSTCREADHQIVITLDGAFVRSFVSSQVFVSQSTTGEASVETSAFYYRALVERSAVCCSQQRRIL